jgi:AcrR family transcriptional regulator
MSVTAPVARRVPTQERSRRRVAKVLDAAARIVVRDGVEALTTREIAGTAGVPIATLYQYFADKEAVLIALAQRDTDEMDAEVAEALASLESEGILTVASVVRATMEAFVRVYHRRRAFVEIYLRGRTNAAVHRFGREHNQRVAADLLTFARDAGLAGPDLTEQRARLAVEVGDRIFQLAFEHDDEGDPGLVEEGIVLVTSYLERYAATTPRNSEMGALRAARSDFRGDPGKT